MAKAQDQPIPPGSANPADFLCALEESLDRVRTLGVRINPSSRFPCYLRRLQRVAAGAAVDPRERAQAHLETSQFITIGQSLLSSPGQHLVRKLQAVMSDPLLPQDGSEESPGRDTQFELFLAAQFANAGLPVSFDEPDIVVMVNGQRVGFAAKRVKSSGLERRLDEAQDGSFSQGRLSMYNEALATTALAEAYGLTRDTELKDPAQRGVEFLQRAQRPSPTGNGLWGWRYASRMDVEQLQGSGARLDPQAAMELYDSDTSVTAWGVMALRSAQISGLTVKKESMEGALAFCKWVTGPDGLVGYLNRTAAGQTVTGPDDHYTYHPTAMSALGMCIRIFAEHNIDDPFLKLAADRIIHDPPTVTEDRLSVDYYYWYYGSLALNQIDGPGTKKSGKYWAPWNKQVNEALTELQDKSERTCQTGGWIFPDRWAHDGGPIYTTAMAIRTLQMSR